MKSLYTKSCNSENFLTDPLKTVVQCVRLTYGKKDNWYASTIVFLNFRFSALPEGGRYYPRPESTEEAKARMMHMEAQLSQLTGMVEKALKNKKLGKKTVSFDKSVTYSDDPQPQPQGILVTAKSKQQQGQGELK